MSCSSGDKAEVADRIQYNSLSRAVRSTDAVMKALNDTASNVKRQFTHWESGSQSTSFFFCTGHFDTRTQANPVSRQALEKKPVKEKKKGWTWMDAYPEIADNYVDCTAHIALPAAIASLWEDQEAP